LLETAWESLERAGYVPANLKESVAGIYVGTSSSVAPGQLSALLGLQGPAMAVDTARSSSLVTLHLACLALRSGECDLALAGGVAIMATREPFAEGCGMLVLKRLGDAERDRDRILALVLGTEVNRSRRGQEGPDNELQQRVIRRSLELSDLSPADIDYVETHGLGTAQGDPIEAGALGAVYSSFRTPEQPLHVGSLTSNIGPAQAVAGVGGVIKVVLSLLNQELPRTPHEVQRFDWETSGLLALLRSARPWPRGERVRRAGVSALGVGGSNAHVVIEEAPQSEIVGGTTVDVAQPLVFPLSAWSEASLRGQVGLLKGHLESKPELSLLDVAHTLAHGRTHFEHRAAVVASSREELISRLGSLSSGEVAAGVVVTPPGGLIGGKLAYLFTGDGAQRERMGRELYDKNAPFREALEGCASYFDRELDRPLLEVMFAEEDSEAGALLRHAAYAQPASFALEWALYRMWSSFGVEPNWVMGSSVGELVAATASEVWSLADGCRLIAARGQLMQALPSGGAMVSVEASEKEVLPHLSEDGQEVTLAANNGPREVLLSGSESAVVRVSERLAEQGFKVRRLEVSQAFHSVLMEPMLEPFAKVARTVRIELPRRPLMISSLSGRWADELVIDPWYWARQLRDTVRFAEGVRTLESEGVRIYLELGPRSAISGKAARCVSESAPVGIVPSLSAGQPEWESVLKAIGSLYALGWSVNWSKVQPSGQIAVLPSWFDRQLRQG
jgi:acyl transferase domain-containing protein